MTYQEWIAMHPEVVQALKNVSFEPMLLTLWEASAYNERRRLRNKLLLTLDQSEFYNVIDIVESNDEQVVSSSSTGS